MDTQTKVPLEVVAAITAAIAAAMDQPVGSFAITSIEPERSVPVPQPSAWAKAGLIQAQMARSAFLTRSR